MKRSVYAIFLGGVLSAVPAAQSTTMAYWDFEDGVDGQLFDADGGGDSGSIDTVNRILMRGFDAQLGASFSADNLYYNGLCMRAADSQHDGYVVNSPLQYWSPTHWTIECTARLDELNDWQTLIGRDGSVHYEPASDFYLENDATNHAFRLNFKTAGGQRVIIDATNIVVEAGRWYGVAAVSDGRKASLFIDEGNGYGLEASATLTGTNIAENALPGSPFTWTFGRGWYDGIYVNRINGAIDNIRFSDTALAPAELIPVPQDPFMIICNPTGHMVGQPQPIDVTIVDLGSTFSSVELSVDETIVATNSTPDGNTNRIHYTAADLQPGMHTVKAAVTGVSPSVTITRRWTFTTEKPPVETMIDGAEPGRWTMDLDAAKQVAAEKQLSILLDFSGSDWCGWCKLMEANVFTKIEWEAYATNHLMMVLIDFPNDKSLVPQKYAERNQSLKTQYNVRGYPTFILLDDDGETELGRLSAGRNKTPASFRTELEQLLDLRSTETEDFTKQLSPEEKTAYLSLLDRLKEAKREKQQAEKEYRAMITTAQMKMYLLEQSEEWLKDDLRYFRLAWTLDAAERQAFEELTVTLQEARQMLTDWVDSTPEQTDYNMKLFQEMISKVRELKKELSPYDQQDAP